MKRLFTLLLCSTLLAACNGAQDDGGTSTGPSELSLSKTTLMMKVGEQSILTVNPKGTPVSWTTSDADVATVNLGIVTANAFGTAVITAATADGVSASCTVYVPTLAITPSPALLTIGSSLRMEVTVIPEDAELQLRDQVPLILRENQLGDSVFSHRPFQKGGVKGVRADVVCHTACIQRAGVKGVGNEGSIFFCHAAHIAEASAGHHLTQQRIDQL